MGSVGNFLFGGSKDKQNSQNSASSLSGSANTAQNSNVQGSQSTSNQQASNASGAGNQAYGPLSAALMPSLGYVNSAGSMMGALLGLPDSQFSYNQPAPSVLPTMPAASPPSGGGGSMVDTLFSKYLSSNLPQPPAPASPAPPPIPAPPSIAVSAPTGGVSSGGRALGRNLRAYATGGDIKAGQPAIVGEQRPEIFVPNTSGTIVPAVPGMPAQPNRPGFNMASLAGTTPTTNPVAPLNPTGALNNFSNSAGMDFIRDQGQKAISGASAANGTFNSGATGKALEQYGTNLGKTYLDQYMSHLMDYAKLGLGSASALSGAGGVSQSIGSSSGGANSSSFGYGQGTSSGSSFGNSLSSGTGSSSGSSKKGLLPDIMP